MLDEDDPEFCPHFADGTPKSVCSRCNGKERADFMRTHAVKREFQARYDGTCSLCQSAFTSGTTIYELANGKYTCCKPQQGT